MSYAHVHVFPCRLIGALDCLYTIEIGIFPLPPVNECGFLPLELNELQMFVNTGVDGCPYRVFILHRRCKAVIQNQESHVLGAKKSRSSLVLCQRVDRDEKH